MEWGYRVSKMWNLFGRAGWEERQPGVVSGKRTEYSCLMLPHPYDTMANGFNPQEIRMKQESEWVPMLLGFVCGWCS